MSLILKVVSSSLYFCFTIAAGDKLWMETRDSISNQSCDYVVIGGGTAGLTVATRLSESNRFTACVIEAGGFYEQSDGNRSTTPGYSSYGSSTDPTTASDTPLIDWGFVTAPQTGLNNNTFHYTRGRTLGGSSARNFMVYHRGNSKAYDIWADAVGDQSYTFNNLLPYFRKSTRYSSPNTHLRAANATVPEPSKEAYNASGGPLQVSHPNWALPMSSYAEAAFSSIGLLPIRDFSSGKMIGAQYVPQTVGPPDEKRSSSEASYLQFALDSGRTNLKVFNNTLAKRIIFNENKSATAVLVTDSDGNEWYINAEREIILSAGAFQSPQLLMVSGIGPRSTLEDLGIDVLIDKPGVGTNMWDHPSFSLVQEVNVETLSGLTDPAKALKAAQSFNRTHTGILTSNGADYIGWEKLPDRLRSNLSNSALADLATFPSDWPEIETVVGALPVALGGPIGTNYGLVFSTIVAPLSRGNISLISKDTSDLPIINPAYLTHPTDQEVGIQLFKRMRQLLSAFPVVSNGTGVLVGEELVPGPGVDSDDDAAILDFLRSSGSPAYHAACTCKMGRLNDTMAVVDSKARVIGVKGLRVVDTSSFPILPPGHPQATIYAFAEKIAAEILQGTN